MITSKGISNQQHQHRIELNAQVTQNMITTTHIYPSNLPILYANDNKFMYKYDGFPV